MLHPHTLYHFSSLIIRRISANYFCAYSQLYHQKQMLTDHNRMAAYHAGEDITKVTFVSSDLT